MAMPAYESWDDEPDGEPEKGVGDITAAEKYEFLQMIWQGYDRREAAAVLGYKARPWRALTSPLSPFYDEEFTNAYFEAKGSPETQMNYIDRLREEVRRRALTDSDRLLEIEAKVHLPEYAILRQKDVNVNVLAVVEQSLKELPTELLKSVLAALESGEVETIEDAQIFELPPGGKDEDDPPVAEDGDGDHGRA